MDLTIITDEERAAEGSVDRGRILLDPAHLPATVGWELKPEGLCQGLVCVPVADRGALFVDHLVDVGAVAAALGRQVVIDAGTGVAAVALPAEERRRALEALEAPPFTLPDLDGLARDLDEWRGRKRLLLAFSSW